MEEGGHGKGWLIWVLIVPVCMAAGALLARWALPRRGNAEPAVQEQAAAPEPAPEQAKPDEAADFKLPGDDAAGNASVTWSDKPGAGTSSGGGTQAAAAPGLVTPAAAKKYAKTGFLYGVLTKAAGGLLKDPKAMSALFNNEYVVKGFMSRDTVKAATANEASLAAYLKNPANLSAFMAKEPVQQGMNDQQLVNAVASSKLMGVMLDTPGAKALLNDPLAMAGIIKANPGIVIALSNPAILGALAQNPKTAGIVGQLSGSLH
jgi:hypothetical protein